MLSKNTPNIIDTLKDRKLLGQFIEDPTTWKAWFCFLRAFFALKPNKGDRGIFQEATGRSQWPREPAKEAWLVIGSRGGKSFISALVATFLAVFRKHQLSPGEKGYVIVVSPTKRQSTIIKRYLSSFFNDNLFLKPYFIRETTEEIELSNNVIIAVLASDYRSLRGYTAIACIIDEVAYLSLEGSKPDTEVVRALRSRLITTKGPLICISSPYAKRGELYNVHKRHFGKDGSPILVWQAPSAVMNPTLDQKVIDQAYTEDPEGARADYGARFRSDIESFVTREATEACVAQDRYELPPIRRMRYRGFVDPSGGSRDSMTLAIGHDQEDRKILDCIREQVPPFSPESVVDDFSHVLKRYGVVTVTGDRYAGEWPRERFRAHGIKYNVADRPKSDIYRDFLPLINSGQVELLDDPKLISQILNLERRTARGGRDSIDHPPGGHDDLANVAAGVCVGTVMTGWAGAWGTEYLGRYREGEGVLMSEEVPMSQVANAGVVTRFREEEKRRKQPQDQFSKMVKGSFKVLGQE